MEVIDDRHGLVTVPVDFWAENPETCVVVDLRARTCGSHSTHQRQEAQSA